MSTRIEFVILLFAAAILFVLFGILSFKIEAIVKKLVERRSSKLEALERIENRKELWRRQELAEMNRDWIGVPWM